MLYYSALLWIIWWSSWLLVGRSSKPTVYREPFQERLAHLIPLLSGVILIFCSLVIKPVLSWDNITVQYVGLAATAIGLLTACWARAHLGRNWSGLVVIKDDHKLISSGPYSWVRHPIYTGLILAMIGSAMTAGTITAILGVSQITIAFVTKLSHEERLLEAEFGMKHRALCFLVPDKLLPFIF